METLCSCTEAIATPQSYTPQFMGNPIHPEIRWETPAYLNKDLAKEIFERVDLIKIFY